MNSTESENELTKELKKRANEEGFNPVGIARVPGSDQIELRTKALQNWLNEGNHADMGWMEAPRRQNINTLLKGVKSVLSVGLNYYVKVKKKPESLSIARYGWGTDYHKIINKRLKRIGRWLEKERPNCKWKICVDSSPLLEKAWAEEAGLGWIGKNSNLINHKYGSWMFLGHLLCTEVLTPDKPSKPKCGKCTICIDKCPTKAITKPFIIDSRKCLAYHTIENRNPELEEDIKKSMGTWIAGCDICQEICPWNHKNIPSSNDPEITPKEWILDLTIEKALTWNDCDWKEKLKGSALKRMKPWMWKRNANAIKLHL